MDDNKAWQVAWARFIAFQKAPPAEWDTKTVRDFHDVLNALEATSPGDDLSAFRISTTRMEPQIIAGSSMADDAVYTNERYCEDSYARRQVEGVAAYFAGCNPVKR